MVRLDPLDPWHYRFYRRHIRTAAECPYCGRGLTEADVEGGKCPSCKRPLRQENKPTSGKINGPT
ncbi:MAG: hypothetical protein QW424_00755 [Candidatus Bathyarchaeia archaeon]